MMGRIQACARLAARARSGFARIWREEIRGDASPEQPARQPRWPAKDRALARLLECGVTFGTVIDVGVQQQTRELRTVFSGSRHILFEPVEEYFSAIADNYRGMNYELVDAAVSTADGTLGLRKHSVPGTGVTHSGLVEETNNVEATVRTVRLDTFMGARSEPKPYLLKVDVDGLEIQILESARDIWKDIHCVIVEATVTTVHERMHYIASRGFQLFEVVDQCYYDGLLYQMDLILVADSVVEKFPGLRPWIGKPFDLSKWAEPTRG